MQSGISAPLGILFKEDLLEEMSAFLLQEQIPSI
jgi:hypothetical protein